MTYSREGMGGQTEPQKSACPTCGATVRVVATGEGTAHYEPQRATYSEPEALGPEGDIATPAEATAGPARLQDEVAIRRKIYAAVTAADDLLRDLWLREQSPEAFEGVDFASAISRVRGKLAEWRVESE